MKEYAANDLKIVAEFDRREDAEALRGILENAVGRIYVPVVYTVFRGVDGNKEAELREALERIYTMSGDKKKGGGRNE